MNDPAKSALSLPAAGGAAVASQDFAEQLLDMMLQTDALLQDAGQRFREGLSAARGYVAPASMHSSTPAAATAPAVSVPLVSTRRDPLHPWIIGVAVCLGMVAAFVSRDQKAAAPTSASCRFVPPGPAAHTKR